MDYYVVLGIAEDADQETIRTAFRALARRYHPDAGAGSSADAFQRAREAYETLVDPERRRRYDLKLRAARVQPVAVRERIVWRPFAEPLFGPRRTSFDVPVWRVSIIESSLAEDVVGELFGLLDDPWFQRGRRR
jgi:curved DNA-binding protein CbpA